MLTTFIFLSSMTACNSCLLIFPLSKSQTCQRCIKKLAATGQAERDEFDVRYYEMSCSCPVLMCSFQTIPQCESCGVLYRFLSASTKTCGHCLLRMCSFSTCSSCWTKNGHFQKTVPNRQLPVNDLISVSACVFTCSSALKGSTLDSTVASLTDQAAHHEQLVSQHRLNQPSSKQNSALQSASAIKQKVALLKKQVKSETFTVNVTLWIYPVSGKRTARKVRK